MTKLKLVKDNNISKVGVTNILGYVDTTDYVCGFFIMKNMQKAVWSTQYINSLPDSCFAYVKPGTKDDEGKTVPRSNRYLPYKDKSGKPDAAHVRNALARLPQADISEEAKAKAKKKLLVAAKKLGIQVSKIGKGVNTMKKDELKDKVADEVIEKHDEEEELTEAPAVVFPEDEDKATEEAVDVVEEKVEDEEVVEEEVEEEAEKVDAVAEEGVKPDVTVFEKLLDAINSLGEKVDNLTQKGSPDEGAAVTNETPIVEAKVEASEEAVAKVDEVKEEVAEAVEAPVITPEPEITKADASPEDDRLEAMAKTIEDLGKANAELQERLKKLEDMPTQAKVVVSRDVMEKTESNKDELQKIEDRLKEIAKIRDLNPMNYTESLMDEALKLIEKKKTLL